MHVALAHGGGVRDGSVRTAEIKMQVLGDHAALSSRVPVCGR